MKEFFEGLAATFLSMVPATRLILIFLALMFWVVLNIFPH